MTAARVLVIDDDTGLLTLMKTRLSAAGYAVSLAASGDEAISLAQQETFQVAILDLKLGGMDGIAVMQGLLQIQPSLPVIILTAYASFSSAVDATKKGAYDYLTKPFEAKALLHSIAKALEVGQLKNEVHRLRLLIKDRYNFDNIIAASQKMQHVLDQVAQVAGTDSTICLYGESGTGKELIAKTVHLASARANFVAINCGAIPEGLLESELFGHVKGAFTGAARHKRGLFQEADGGTLFMDEIAELSPALQVKLLRVLQEQEFYPVGAVQPQRVNVRFITATNQDLGKAIAEGRFREDLYYRIHVIPIHLPPLRERQEDIPLLAQHFLQRFNREMGKNIAGFSPEAMQTLMQHRWPGNVRELANVVERCVVLAQSETIQPEHLLLGNHYQEDIAKKSKLPPLNEARQEFERAYLVQVMTAAQGNVTRAASLAGRYRPELYKLLRKYDLDPATFKETAKQLDQPPV